MAGAGFARLPDDPADDSPSVWLAVPQVTPRARSIRTSTEGTFWLADGTPTNAYGRVEFQRSHVREPAPYIRLAAKTPIRDVISLLEQRWEVPEPKVLISITGAAQDFRVQPHVSEVVNEGLCRAAKQTDAWIVTGGTDTGVMKLVGDAVAKSHLDVPVIGIASWGATHGCDQLVCDAGAPLDVDATGDDVDADVRFYAPMGAADSMGASLNPNHTHFILVDAPTPPNGSPFGLEIPFRMALEERYSEANKLPTVCAPPRRRGRGRAPARAGNAAEARSRGARATAPCAARWQRGRRGCARARRARARAPCALHRWSYASTAASARSTLSCAR